MSGVRCRISIPILGVIHFRYVPVVWCRDSPRVPVTGFRVDMEYGSGYYYGLHAYSFWRV